MNGLGHFFISKFKQDSMELGAILAINLFFLSLLAFVAGAEKLDAQVFQVFLYFNCYVAVFLDLMSFGQKYYLSLPLNRQHVLFNLAFAKLVNFIPCFAIFTIGYARFPKSEIFNSGYLTSMLMFMVLAFIINLYTLQYDITKPRIEHAKKKFMYFLVMLKILINYIFFSSILAYSGAFIYYKGWHENFRQWHIILLLIGFAVLKFFNLLKILLDEKTTYWYWKRDGLFSLGKLSLIVVPLAIYSLFFNENKLYSGNEILQAAYKNNVSSVERLLKDGADPNYENEHGMTPIFVSLIKGNEEIFEVLLRHGGKIHSDAKISAKFTNVKDYKSLDLAVYGKNEKLVKRLVDLNMAYFSIEDKNVLHRMANYCTAPGIFEVLRTKVDVNSTDKSGNTPLMYAVKKKCWPLTLALIQNGAKLDIKNKKGKTAIDLSKDNKNLKWLFENIYQYNDQKKVKFNRIPASTRDD